MIFSAFLTCVLLLLVVYAQFQKKQFPIVWRTLPLVCFAGIYVAWFPEETSKVAELVGVGRGTDLIFYIWALASGLLIFALHLKLVTQDRKITELARVIAIGGATHPVAAEGRGAAPEVHGRPGVSAS